MLRLRKPKPFELLSEFQSVRREAEAIQQAFTKLPTNEIPARVAVAREMLAKSVRANQVLFDFLARFSPTAAKQLKFKLENHERVSEKLLTDLPDQTIPGREVIINDRISTMFQFIDINQQLADIVFVTAMETTKRTGRPPPEQLDEYLQSQLHKLDGDYAKLYEGAWKALEAEGNPDRFRQCAASARELVIRLVGAKGSQRRNELRGLLDGNREASLAESLANTVEELYETLSKGVHSEIDFETALLCIKITEHLTRYLFERGYSSTHSC